VSDEPQSNNSPFQATIKGRCPRCATGKLYVGVLKLGQQCSHCDLDFTPLSQDDGPAAFAMFVVGPLVVGPAVWFELSQNPPLWMHLVWLPWAGLLTVGSLRLIKSWLVAAQFKHQAHEGQLEDGKEE